MQQREPIASAEECLFYFHLRETTNKKPGLVSPDGPQRVNLGYSFNFPTFNSCFVSRFLFV